MSFNKLLGIFITTCSALCIVNISQASVTCEFSPVGKCLVECDGAKYPFNSLEELSSNINSITNNYFIVDSVTCTPDYETISFNNFKNCYCTNGYNLTFKGTKHFYPNIELNYENNEVIFPKINLECITHLNINSEKIKNCGKLPKLKITEEQISSDDEIVYCSIF